MEAKDSRRGSLTPAIPRQSQVGRVGSKVGDQLARQMDRDGAVSVESLMRRATSEG